MARRHGRPGNWLATDDITGATVYGSKLKRGYYGELAVKPFQRNLQEIASPLNDPTPVPFYRGPQYEVTPTCVAAVAPLFVGTTTVRTSFNNAAAQALDLDPAIPDMEVGCSWIVR
jgi:hypothetical protein